MKKTALCHRDRVLMALHLFLQDLDSSIDMFRKKNAMVSESVIATRDFRQSGYRI